MAQLAHCKAQGKIGSGFDISAAVFGSQVYIRRDPQSLSETITVVDKVTPSELYSIVSKSPWSGVQRKFLLPPGLHLILGECGKDMHTVTSVRKVIEWRNQHRQESTAIFTELDENNRRVIELFTKLHELASNYTDSYNAARILCSQYTPSEWRSQAKQANLDENALAVLSVFEDLRESFFKVRANLREAGNKAGTPIEPSEMTELLDYSMNNVPGILIAGCPGGSSCRSPQLFYLHLLTIFILN